MNLEYLFSPTKQFTYPSGKLLDGGKVFVYLKDTTDLATLYSPEGSFVSNPILLDANGRASVRADVSYQYRLEIYTNDNVLLYTCEAFCEGNGSGGFSFVIHDNTLSGNGTASSPLGVLTIPFAVDNTTTAYEDVIEGEKAVVIGVNNTWFDEKLNQEIEGKVDRTEFEDCCSAVNAALDNKLDSSAFDLSNYYNKQETNDLLEQRVSTYTFAQTMNWVDQEKENKLNFGYDENSAISAINGSALAGGEGGSGDCPWLSGGKQIQETQLITPNMVIQVLSSFDLSGNKNHFIGVKGGTYRFPSSYELVDDIAQTYSFMPTSSMNEYLTTASFSSYSAITDTRITNVNEIANSGLSIATNNLYNKLDISSFNAWTAGSTATLTASGRTCLIGEDNVLVIAPGGVNDVILQGFGNSGTYEDFGQGYENSSFQYAFTQGRYNSANSEAFAQGYENSATKNALAQGSTNKSYYASLAQGIVNTALAYSLAQGYENSANSYSIAQGAGNTAFDNSISQGNGNFADHYSVAIGYDNNSYDFGFAFGGHLIASGLMALGTYNKVSSNASFVIGNGNYDDINQSAVYSDSFIIFKDGSLSAAGDISANGKKLTNSNCYCVKFTNELTSVNLSSYDSFDKVTVINPIEYGNNCLLNYNGNVKTIASGVWIELVNGLNHNNENEWFFTNSGIMSR